MTHHLKYSFVFLILGLIAALNTSCTKEIDNASPQADEQALGTSSQPRAVTPSQSAAGATAAPAISLKVYPDMAVPGREVSLEARVSGLLSDEPFDLTFIKENDPCEGELVQSGHTAVFHVPKDCRGSKIQIAAVAKGSFGETSKSVSLEIKKTTSMESVVLRSPLPYEKVVSPVLARWDRSLYQNRGETMSFKASIKGEHAIRTPIIRPESIVELDIPPSPEETLLVVTTSGGSEENLRLKILERKVPEFPLWARVLNDGTGDGEKLSSTIKVVNEGGDVDAGVGHRYSAAGIDTFTFFTYHVAKAQRQSNKQAALGIQFDVTGDSSSASYEYLHVWIRGDKTLGFSSPVYVQIKGNMGGMRRFKIVRARENWTDFRFPIRAGLKEGKGETLTQVSIFVDARDATPALGLILFGGAYLEPPGMARPSGKSELPAVELEPDPNAPQPGAELPENAPKALPNTGTPGQTPPLGNPTPPANPSKTPASASPPGPGPESQPAKPKP